MIAKNLEKLLKQSKIKHKIVEHRKVFTAFDAASTQHLKTAEVVKAVLLKGKNLHMAVLPSGHNCDFKTLSKLVGEKVSMAREKDIIKLFSAKGVSASGGKTKVGLLSPFGSLFKIPVYIDKKILKNKKINLPAGSYTESVIISVKDYLKLENPTPGNFSIKK